MTEQAAAYDALRNSLRCPHSECKDAPYDGTHFTGGYAYGGSRYYREFDEGCPWADDEGEEQT